MWQRRRSIPWEWIRKKICGGWKRFIGAETFNRRMMSADRAIARTAKIAKIEKQNLTADERG
jgi:hypothetical protein